MGQRVLVLGGTRYFGKRLVEKLLHEGCDVTIATRGQVTPSFDRNVNHITLDRESRDSLKKAAETSWDVVYDQICYSPNDAAIACEIFEGQVGRYIHTSTQSVYVKDGEVAEKDFDPFNYPITMGSRTAFNYGEGKRLAEAVFFQKAKFDVTALRIPIVAGLDDYTGRLEFHIDRVRDGKTIVIPNTEARVSFIDSDEAASVLAWLRHQPKRIGPINAASYDQLTMGEIMALVEAAVGKKAAMVSQGNADDMTPFSGAKSRYLDVTKARQMGFKLSSLRDWFPQLVQEMARRRRA